jgi:hypothetical protein
MKVLIVISKDSARASLLTGLVQAELPGNEPLSAGRGFDSYNKTLNALVVNSGPHDLVIHHCGATNSEYSFFVPAYESLCRDRSWDLPPLILFSGSFISVETADKTFARDSRVCVVSQSTLEINLGSFLRALRSPPSGFDDVPWYILRGYGEREYPLQLLSALLPFGVMWEASGEAGSRKGLKTASEKLSIDLFRGTERIIAERVKALSAIEPKDYQSSIPGNANHATAFIDRLMDKKVKTSVSAKELENLASAVCGRPDLNLDSALQVITSSTSLRNWNRRLSLLRDCLLD